MDCIEVVLNDDGTICDPPKNPLIEKWERLYPPCGSGAGYSCMYCNKCHHGDYWKIPEEDMDAYNKHMEEYSKYMREHNPILYDSEKRREYIKKTLDMANKIKKDMGL